MTTVQEKTMPKKPITHQRLSRREALRLAGAAGAITLVGRQFAGEPAAAQSTTTPPCIVTPAETEGPYFVDEMLNHSDLRVDPTDNSVQPGVPLVLKLAVSRVDNGVCTPLTGATVDAWHASALGLYSDEAVENTQGRKFLRGYQVTDANGVVQFTSVYPGWYMGRTVHIHFKVRMYAGTTKTYEFTSQVFMDDTITNAVFALAPYNTRGARDTRNATDGIYLGTMGAGGPGQQQAPAASSTTTSGTTTTPPGEMLMVALTPVKAGDVSQGFVGTYAIGLTLA
jgi:protocatechuate 3,4-dioxygenase beta subunit